MRMMSNERQVYVSRLLKAYFAIVKLISTIYSVVIILVKRLSYCILHPACG